MERGLRLGKRAGLAGAVACLLGLALELVASPVAAAAGIECMALGFWIWARAADDARDQVPRWRWLRRPATALWLAAALAAALGTDVAHLILPTHEVVRGATPEGAAQALGPLRLLRAGAIVWGGLELVAALPVARPFWDFPGPYLPTRSWIPVVLPCAGFLVLWAQADLWRHLPQVRGPAVALLIVTALLGALRAFARRGWTASLRWLAAANTALALVPLALRAVHPQAVFLLWLGAFGGPAFVLAGELAGASPRRGRRNARLWRAASWLSTASLGWTALQAVASNGPGWARVLGWLACALTVAISTWIMVGRLEVAVERRRVMRPGSGMTAGLMAGLLVASLGPEGLAIAWWYGFEPSLPSSALALLPAVLGAASAVLPRQKRLVRVVDGIGRTAGALRVAGGATFRRTVRLEQVALRWLTAVGRVVAAPLGDLHTGDAQEYLLLVAGVAVLALLLPLI